MMPESNYFGYAGFVWWIGVVEDRHDPLKTGRCRVRIAGSHTSDKKLIPTEELPWAHPMLPLTDSSMLMFKEGDYVVGFYLDGPNAQHPIMMGILPGIPDQLLDKSVGFADPRTDAELKGSPRPPKTLESSPGVGVKITEFPQAQRYPNVMNEPTISRLARNEVIGETIVQSKKDSLVKNAATTYYHSFNEPMTPYAAQYPYNKVIETESGHLLEYDDTPGAERIHFYHRSGSFIEMHTDGTVVVKTASDGYEFVLADKKIYVSGDCHITSDKNINIKAKNDIVMEATNIIMKASDSMDVEVTNNINITNGKKFSVLTGVDIDVTALNNIAMMSGQKYSVLVGDSMSWTTVQNTTIVSGQKVAVSSGGNMVLGSLGVFSATGTSAVTLYTPGTATLQGLTAQINPGTTIPLAILPPLTVPLPTLPSFLIPSQAAIETLKDASEQKLIAVAGPEASMDGGANPQNAASLATPQSSPPATSLPTDSQVDSQPAPSTQTPKTTCAGVTVPPIDYELQLSKRFKLKHVTTAALFSHYIPEGGLNGKNAGEIICNLKALCEQVLEPLCDQYPGFRINSAFRNQTQPSQHPSGEAADLQWPGYSIDQLYKIAQWMKQNLSFDQLIFEYDTSAWIHVSFVRQENGGNRAPVVTNKVCSYKPDKWPNPLGPSGYYTQGLVLLADRAQTKIMGGGTTFA